MFSALVNNHSKSVDLNLEGTWGVSETIMWAPKSATFLPNVLAMKTESIVKNGTIIGGVVI